MATQSGLKALKAIAKLVSDIQSIDVDDTTFEALIQPLVTALHAHATSVYKVAAEMSELEAGEQQDADDTGDDDDFADEQQDADADDDFGDDDFADEQQDADDAGDDFSDDDFDDDDFAQEQEDEPEPEPAPRRRPAAQQQRRPAPAANTKRPAAPAPRSRRSKLSPEMGLKALKAALIEAEPRRAALIEKTIAATPGPTKRAQAVYDLAARKGWL